MKYLLKLMNNRWISWLLIILTLYFCYRYIHFLNKQSLSLKQTNIELTQLINVKNQSLLKLQQQSHYQQKALIEQKNSLQYTEKQMREYSRHIEKLKHENKQLRIWFDSNLPDDVKRLLERPDITGSSDYRRWLSNRNALLSSIEYSEQQPVVNE